MLCPSFKNVSSNWGRADERDRFDFWMRKERIDTIASAMNDTENAFGQARLFEQLRDLDGGERNLFTGLEDERIAAGNRHRIHPERDHRGEIEGRDACANAERLADGVAINSAGNILEALAHEQRGHATSEFDHLDPAPNVTARFDQGFPMLASVAANDF